MGGFVVGNSAPDVGSFAPDVGGFAGNPGGPRNRMFTPKRWTTAASPYTSARPHTSERADMFGFFWSADDPARVVEFGLVFSQWHKDKFRRARRFEDNRRVFPVVPNFDKSRCVFEIIQNKRGI